MTFSRFYLLSSGIDPEMPFEDAIRTRMVNIFALLASLAAFSYLFIYKGLFLYLTAGFMVCFAATWLFNYLGWIYFSKIWLYTMAHVALFLSASAFGREAGEQMVLIPVLFGGVLVFHSREKWSLGYAITLTVVTFLILGWTNYSLFSLSISPETRMTYYHSNLIITIIASVVAALLYFRMYKSQLHRTEETLSISRDIEDTINYFSTSLFGQNTEEEVLWDVAKNCISRLDFEDCVIYLLNEENQLLKQKAAYGEKNPKAFDIKDPIEIPVGQGIVGYVARTGKSLRVPDTTKDPRYITDDQFRYSELAVPLIYNDKVIGVLDSEHSQKNFFTRRHERLLQTIAALCANKIVRALAEEEQKRAIRIQMEAEKIKAIDELKTRLLTNLSHELRTPLTLIMGTIDKHLPAPDNSDWHILKKHSNRLLRLINQLLDLTRLESGQFRLNPASNDISAFFRMAIALFESLANSRNVSIVYKGITESLYLHFDQDALEKIFYNILSNAIKFTKEGTAILFESWYKDDLLSVRIQDQGPGIASAHQEKIFDRFYQFGEDRSGTGIGLAITRELATLHKGQVLVESEEGTGSTFLVHLPLSRAILHEKPAESGSSLEPEDEDSRTKENSNKPSVLIIEDNREVAELLQDMLNQDYQVNICFDGESGIKEAQETIPDLIISDIMMPGIDGIEVCRELKSQELTNHIPIILLTARADMESKIEGLHTGADDYLVKPFHSEELLSRIDNLLTQRRILREKYKKIIELQTGEMTGSSEEEIFLQKLWSVVDKNLDDSDFNVQHLAETMHLSRMQLHRKITALTGHSANEFIRDIRLQRAAQLLSKGELVSQAAYSVGYSSLSNFTKIFKEKFGVLPSEYN